MAVVSGGVSRTRGYNPTEARAVLARLQAIPAPDPLNYTPSGLFGMQRWISGSLPPVALGKTYGNVRIKDQPEQPDNPGIREVSVSTYGNTIPVSLGRRRVSGNIVQSTNIIPRLPPPRKYFEFYEVPVTEYIAVPKPPSFVLKKSDGDDERGNECDPVMIRVNPYNGANILAGATAQNPYIPDPEKKGQCEDGCSDCEPPDDPGSPPDDQEQSGGGTYYTCGTGCTRFGYSRICTTRAYSRIDYMIPAVAAIVRDTCNSSRPGDLECGPACISGLAGGILPTWGNWDDTAFAQYCAIWSPGTYGELGCEIIRNPGVPYRVDARNSYNPAGGWRIVQINGPRNTGKYNEWPRTGGVNNDLV